MKRLNIFAFFVLFALVSCNDKVNVEPKESSDFMLKKKVQLKDFQGIWIRNDDAGSPYRKIEIHPESNGSYRFEYFVYNKNSQAWETDAYTLPQTITEENFTSADESGFLDPTPYLTVKVKIIKSPDEKGIIRYSIKKGVHSLEYELNHLYKQESEQ